MDRNFALKNNFIDRNEYDDFTATVKKIILNRFISKYASSAACGLKVAPYQVQDDLTGFIQHAYYLFDKFIILYRQNVVQTAISQIWSIERNKQIRGPHLVKGEENTVNHLEIDYRMFEWFLISSTLERFVVIDKSIT